MSRSTADVYAKQHELVRRFVEEATELCDGNPYALAGVCMMTVLAPLSAMHNGNPESVALNLEALAAGVAAKVRSGDLELGRDTH